MTTSQSIILGMGKNNIFNTLKLISKHQPEIEAHLKGQTYEGLNGDGAIIPGMTNTVAIITIVITLILWLWALYITVKYFNQISLVAQIFAILGLLGFGGPIITLLAVYISISRPPAPSTVKGSKFLGKY